ncbi:MAG TPA: creatininase family protein, partial [Acetobacteraceae bacterium]|nr:creatininase family protein [Acetobacteraceae bacterium]
GTITLSLESFVGMVTDVAESLHRTGFKRLLIVNGHGGNQGPLRSACTTLAARGLAVGYVNYFGPGEKQWLEVLPGVQRGVGHACAYETALQMALRPAEAARIATRIDNLPPRLTPCYLAGNAPDVMRSAGAYWAPIFVAGDVGYVGDPAAATVDSGMAILEATATALAKFFADFATAQLRVGAP